MILFLMTLAAAQGVTLSGTATGKPTRRHPEVHLECAAFRPNNDGSWTSLRPTQVGTVSISAGGTFHAGVTLGGIDLGAELRDRCPGSAKHKRAARK